MNFINHMQQGVYMQYTIYIYRIYIYMQLFHFPMIYVIICLLICWCSDWWNMGHILRNLGHILRKWMNSTCESAFIKVIHVILYIKIFRCFNDFNLDMTISAHLHRHTDNTSTKHYYTHTCFQKNFLKQHKTPQRTKPLFLQCLTSSRSRLCYGLQCGRSFSGFRSESSEKPEKFATELGGSSLDLSMQLGVDLMGDYPPWN